MDIWKENVIEDLESGSLSYIIVGEFLSDLKEEFGREDHEKIKVEQESKIIEKFVQEFRRLVRGSEYEGKLLIEELKREMNGIIKRKLIETKCSPRSIKQ